MSKQTKVLFWGSGKMAAAIATGLARSDQDISLYFYSPSGESATALAAKLGGEVFNTKDGADYDYVILCFKPQQLASAASSLLELTKLARETTLISLLAGVRLERLAEVFSGFQVARVMPNTPILVGEGLLGWVFPAQLENRQTEILELFHPCAEQVVLKNEDELDSYTSIAGSGPAYIFEFARILEDQYLKLGLPPEDSKAIIAKLFLGSSKLMSESSESFESLRLNVTSKGGVTAQALEVFSEHKFADTVKLALKRNIERSKELARE